MPSGEELPSKIRRLASRHALTLTDERWAHGVKTLIDSLEALVTADADQMTAAIPDDIGETKSSRMGRSRLGHWRAW